MITSVLVPRETPSCRPGCGACCIAPSITSPIPGMPDGKPAGTPCAQLGALQECLVFGKPERPAFCAGLQASTEMCGTHRDEALGYLNELERLTLPGWVIGAVSRRACSFGPAGTK